MNSKYLSIALAMVALFLLSTDPAYAQEGAAAAAAAAGIGQGAGIGMGLAVVGCGLGQGRAVAAGLEGIARNPQASGKIQTPLLIGLVFMETLTLFTFGFGFLLIGKI